MAREIFEARGTHERLVVIFHALKGSPQAMADVVEAAKAQFSNADILVPVLPFGGRFGELSFRSPVRIAAQMVERIDRAVLDQPAYQHITLVGYSFGAMVARKVVVIAHGERPGAPFENEIAGQSRRDWAGKIERLVLLAGFSRGWSTATTRDWMTSAQWTVGNWIGEIIRTLSFTKLELSLLQIRQGAPFVVQTRLQWLALVSPPRHEPAATAKIEPATTAKIEVVQLLGAVDDLVAPDDSVDWAIDASSASFALVEVPGATHPNITSMVRPTPAEESALAAAMRSDSPRSIADVAKWGVGSDEPAKEGVLMAQVRWMLFSWSLAKKLDDTEFKQAVITREEMADTPAMQPDKKTTDVVFVIHGIRDRGFWTQKIARTIKREANRANASLLDEDKKHVQSFTGSYGYFAMVPFILPWVRRWKTDWLMDRYTEARALYPRAQFSYVGHSNGTYLLARALLDYPAVRFDRVVFAGSVVRRDYDWRAFLEPKDKARVNEVVSYVATADWVVALLPKGFQPLKFFFDVGSAGHDGFNQARAARITEESKAGLTAKLDNWFYRLTRGTDAKTSPRGLYETWCVKGSHSAGISETQWDDIANFIVRGYAPPKNAEDHDFQKSRSPGMVIGGWLSSIFVILLLWIVIGTGVALFRSIDGAGTVTFAGAVRALWTFILTLACLPCAVIDAVVAVPDVIADLWHWFADKLMHLKETGEAIGAALLGGVRAIFGWLYAALFQGRISTFADPPATGATTLRAAIFAAYCWVVYLLVTRF